MTLQALPEESTADLMAERLREAIIAGQFAPGERLIEADIATAFHTSRGPVREAMRSLAAEGFVVLRKNRGGVVASPTLADVREVYAVRESLGSLAIAQALAAGPPTAAQMRKVRGLLDRMRDCVAQGDAPAMVQADLAFQSALLGLGHLPRVSAILEHMHHEVRFFVTALGIHYDSAAHNDLIARHDRIIAALADGDSGAAVRSWQEHIHHTIDEFTHSHATKETA